jgi:hypothetical protein
MNARQAKAFMVCAVYGPFEPDTAVSRENFVCVLVHARVFVSSFVRPASNC